MKMINLNEYKIIEVEEYKTVDIYLTLRNEMSLDIYTFNDIFKEMLKKEVEQTELGSVQEPVLIIVHTDLLKNDRDIMKDFLFSRVVDHIIMDGFREDKERRLGIPRGLREVRMDKMGLMDLVNKTDNISILNIGIATKSGNDVEYITPEEEL